MKEFSISTSSPYTIYTDKGLLTKVGTYIEKFFPQCKVAVITDSNVNPLYSDTILKSLKAKGFTATKIVFSAGEHSKNITTYGNILEALSVDGLTKSDIILALGGGVVGDMAGFAASTYLRGISYVYVPTTYLAAVDSSIGGKTSINLPSGKNLAGSYWQPSLVLIDPEVFQTLPELKIMDGIAEAIKHSVVSDASLMKHILEHDYNYVIERSISIKRSIVEADETSKGLRQLLNFGHTIAHGIEKVSSYSVSHGHAVAKGMVLEARSAYNSGLTDIDISKDLVEIFTSLGFDMSLDYTVEQLLPYALLDKKISNGVINMVIPESIGKCRLHKLYLNELEDFIASGLK